jgi:hypothetical protein
VRIEIGAQAMNDNTKRKKPITCLIDFIFGNPLSTGGV